MAITFTPDNVLLAEKMHGTVPRSQTEAILQDVMQGSAAMKLAKYIEMRDAQGNPVREKNFSFLTGIAGAYWVGEGERIQTSKPEWKTAKMVAKKLGVIIPVSREFLHYTAPQFFEEVRPLIAEAFYRKFDDAVLLNVGNPFAQSVKQAAEGRKVQGELNYDNILELEGKIEEGGFVANAFVSTNKNRLALRNANKAQNGVQEALFDRANNTLDGLPVANLTSTEMKKGTLLAGNFDYAYYGIPYSINYEISKDATLTTIQEGGKDINLFERELIALRATMDVGFMIVKDEAFGILEPAEM